MLKFKCGCLGNHNYSKCPEHGESRESYDASMDDRAPVCPIEYQAGSYRHILMYSLRPVLNPDYPDSTYPVKPGHMHDFGYMLISEAEESISWLLEHLQPEAVLDLKQAMNLLKRFPNLKI